MVQQRASLLCKSYLKRKHKLLGSQDAGSTNSFDLLFSTPGEKSGLDNDGLLGQNTFTQHLHTKKVRKSLFNKFYL